MLALVRQRLLLKKGGRRCVNNLLKRGDRLVKADGSFSQSEGYRLLEKYSFGHHSLSREETNRAAEDIRREEKEWLRRTKGIRRLALRWGRCL